MLCYLIIIKLSSSKVTVIHTRKDVPVLAAEVLGKLREDEGAEKVPQGGK